MKTGLKMLMVLALLARERKERGEDASDGRRRPALLNSCHAYASDGEIVKRYWPHAYTGDRAAE